MTNRSKEETQTQQEFDKAKERMVATTYHLKIKKSFLIFNKMCCVIKKGDNKECNNYAKSFFKNL